MNKENLISVIRSKIAEYRKEDASLRVEFEEAKKSGNKEEIVRIYNAVIENNQNILTAQKDLVNLMNGKVDAETLNSLNEKYNDYGYVLPDPVMEDNFEVTEPATEEKSHAKGWAAATLALLGVGAAGAAGYAIADQAKDATYDESENDLEVTPSPEVTEEITEEVVELPETTETPNLTSNLKLGEFGTFTDITNDEQVNARAQYIYDNYYKQFLGQMTQGEQDYVTVDKIANVIRVMNGELPVDENGNKIFDINMVDDWGQVYTELIGNYASSPEFDQVYHVPTYLFTLDNTELQDFVKRYDEDYAKIAEGRNERSAEKTRAAIASLGEKMWNEWAVQGMYGDMNPYNFNAKDRLFAYMSTMAPYASYAFEYNLNAMQPVCIYSCIDYNSKEMQEIPVNEIFVGITSGQWNTVIAKAAGVEVDAEPESIAFTQDLLDTLEYKYDHLDTMKLTK